MGENVVERLWRDAKLLEIGSGTLEAHHKSLAKDLCRDPGRTPGLEAWVEERPLTPFTPKRRRPEPAVRGVSGHRATARPIPGRAVALT